MIPQNQLVSQGLMYGKLKNEVIIGSDIGLLVTQRHHIICTNGDWLSIGNFDENSNIFILENAIEKCL